MADITVGLERGLCFYFEQCSEFDRRALPVEKQVAFGFEAGYQAGKAEVKAAVAKIFLPEKRKV